MPPFGDLFRQAETATIVAVFFGTPSGTRTQDTPIKSQLLSQVASSRGVEDSITPTDSGFYTVSSYAAFTKKDRILNDILIKDAVIVISAS